MCGGKIASVWGPAWGEAAAYPRPRLVEARWPWSRSGGDRMPTRAEDLPMRGHLLLQIVVACCALAGFRTMRPVAARAGPRARRSSDSDGGRSTSGPPPIFWGPPPAPKKKKNCMRRRTRRHPAPGRGRRQCFGSPRPRAQQALGPSTRRRAQIVERKRRFRCGGFDQGKASPPSSHICGLADGSASWRGMAALAAFRRLQEYRWQTRARPRMRRGATCGVRHHRRAAGKWK